MNFRKGANRLLVVVIVIWEALWLLLLSLDHGNAGREGEMIFIGAMVGGPVVAFLQLRALFWIVEGFNNSP